MWIGLIFLCLLRSVEANIGEFSRKILAQKCCAHGEYLLFDNKGAGTCTPLEGVTVSKETYERVEDILNRDPAEPTDFEWLPHEFHIRETDKLWVKYSQKDLCPRKHALFISSSENNLYRIGEKGFLIYMAATTGGQILEMPFSNREYCIDKARGLKSPHVFMICPCERTRCIPKCCATDWVLRFSGSNAECQPNTDSKWKPVTNDLQLAEEMTYAVLDGQFPECDYRVGHKEEIDWPHNYVRSWFSNSKGRVFEDKDACTDFLWRDKAPLTRTVASCFRSPEVEVVINRRATLHIIAILMLGISILALINHKVRCTVHLLSLGSYFFSLFLYHILLVSTMWLEELLFPCSIIGSFLYYFTLSSATWLSIASFNIALNSRKLINALPEDERTRYERILCSFYSLYAWGVPAIFVAFTYFVGHPPELPQDTPRPTVRITKTCPDEAGNVKSDMFIYFSAPLILLLIFVTFLFTTTAVQMRLLRERAFLLQRPEILPDTGFYVKWRTIIYLKLMLLVMMLEFALELMEWASTDTSSHLFEIITDFLQLLRAAGIFMYWGSRFFWKMLQMVWDLPDISVSQEPSADASAQRIVSVTPEDVPASSQPGRTETAGDAASTSGAASRMSSLRNPLAVMRSGWWTWRFPNPRRRTLSPAGVSTVPLTEAVAPTAALSRPQTPATPQPARRASQLSSTPPRAGPSQLSTTPLPTEPSQLSSTPPRTEPSQLSTTPPRAGPSQLSTTPPRTGPSQQSSTPSPCPSPSQTSPARSSPADSSVNRMSPSHASPASSPSSSPTRPTVSGNPARPTEDFIAHEKESSL